MCLKPIHIYNRSRRFRTGIDKPILDVPCGHCEKCQARKADDWFVRACAEFQRVKSKGGFCWFPTLTYRNEDLPIWKDKQYNFIAPTFDKSHFVSFRNKLRVYLKRAGFDFKDDNTIRYLYVTEYGSRTGRSHLHCLLFVPQYVDFTLFQDLVAKAWTFGFVMYSPKGRVVESVKALRYVMKYMHKDMNWYNKYGVDDYLQELKHDSKSSLVIKERLRLFRTRLPHHCQSMGFGSDFIVSDNEFVDDSISSARLGLYSVKFNYHVPLYYKRKFLYDFDKLENVYSINPRGQHIKQAMFNKVVDKLDRYYASLLYSDIVENMCQLYCPDLPVTLSEYFTSFKALKDEDSKDVAIFAMVYRGLALHRRNIEVYDDMDSGKFLQLHSNRAYFYFCSSVDNLSTPLVDDYRKNGADIASTYFGFNDTNIYKLYHKGLLFIEEFEKQIGQKCNDALLESYFNQSIQFVKLFHLI